MDMSDVLKQLGSDENLKMTALRRDLLEIFLKTPKPISAYEVLYLLKRKRPNAQPPTVYRVLEYFVQKKIIHRVETGNKYICCSQLPMSSEHHGILFLCQQCGAAQEFSDEAFMKFLTEFSTRHALTLQHDTPIELKGKCERCTFR